MHRHTSLFSSLPFLLLAGCSGGSVSLQAPAAPDAYDRGALLSYANEGILTTTQLAAAPDAAIIVPAGGAAKCSVAVYRVLYKTIGVNGEPTNTSAGIFIPQPGCAGPYPLLGFAEGTNAFKLPPLSSTPSNELTLDYALLYGSHGYVTAATDYLGLGLSTYPFSPYLQANSEAASVIDSMRAARNLAKILGVSLSGQVMLAGASQGGHTAMATQREIEANDASEFQLVGDAPASGPYDLLTSFEYVANDLSPQGPLLDAYTLTGYQKTYHNLYGSNGPSTVFQSPYASTIDSLLPLQSAAQASLLTTDLPAEVAQLLQPSFLATIGQSGSAIDADFAENSLLTGWKPKASVYLCGTDTDPLVTYKNALEASAYFQSIGVKSSLTDVAQYIPSSVTGVAIHQFGCFTCIALARANFLDKLRTAPTSSAALSTSAQTLH